MSKKAISAGQDSKGKWHILHGPSVPYQTQKANMKALVGKGGKATVEGEKKPVSLESWCLYLQTTKRYRARGRGASGLADPQVSSGVQA